jgi:hypothetical protein
VTARDLDLFVAAAVALNARRARSGSLLLAGTDTLDAWLNAESTPVFHAAARNSVQHALLVLLADPAAPWPPVLEVLSRPEVDQRHPPVDSPSAGFAAVTLAIDYVLAQCVARGLLGLPALERHGEIATNAMRALWTRFGPNRAEARAHWQAKEALLMLVFGDHVGVVRRFASEPTFDLATGGDADRTLVELSRVLAHHASGTGDADTPFAARSLVTLTQFHYYRWAVDDDLSARIELPTMVLASQAYLRRCAPEHADARSMLRQLAPAAVVSRLSALREGGAVPPPTRR